MSRMTSDQLAAIREEAEAAYPGLPQTYRRDPVKDIRLMLAEVDRLLKHAQSVQNEADLYYASLEHEKARAEAAEAELTKAKACQVTAVTARCSACGAYCDDVEWEYDAK